MQGVAVAKGQQPHNAAVRQLLFVLAEVKPAPAPIPGVQAEGTLALELTEILKVTQVAVLGKAVSKLHRVAAAEHLVPMAAEGSQRQLTDDADRQPRRVEAAHNADAVIFFQQLLDGFVDYLQILPLKIAAENWLLVKAFDHAMLPVLLLRFALN